MMSYNRDLVGWPYLKNSMSSLSLGLGDAEYSSVGQDSILNLDASIFID
jgi:hypothetical protein